MFLHVHISVGVAVGEVLQRWRYALRREVMVSEQQCGSKTEYMCVNERERWKGEHARSR